MPNTSLKSHIRDIPDFPAPGVVFRDISPLLRSPAAFAEVARQFGQLAAVGTVDAFVGIESRGFILAGYLAAHFKKGFVPLRKVGKLPPPVIAESYSLEYGQATLEMAPGRGKVMIVDDVLATGGTLQAAIRICQKAGYEVEQVGVLIDLASLNRMTFRGQRVFSVLRY